jgi:hypothetical protein
MLDGATKKLGDGVPSQDEGGSGLNSFLRFRPETQHVEGCKEEIGLILNSVGLEAQAVFWEAPN